LGISPTGYAVRRREVNYDLSDYWTPGRHRRRRDGAAGRGYRLRRKQFRQEDDINDEQHHEQHHERLADHGKPVGHGVAVDRSEHGHGFAIAGRDNSDSCSTDCRDSIPAAGSVAAADPGSPADSCDPGILIGPLGNYPFSQVNWQTSV
jgi:hypothetical protein